jgi:hypothetical protein
MFVACLIVAAMIAVSAVSLWAVANGSISGTITDPSGAVIPGATITLTNTALKSELAATSDAQGFYSFPIVPVGLYEMCVEATGFRTEKKTGVTVDTDIALKLDMILQLGEQSETVLVQAATTQIDTATTQLGEVVIGSQMTALPLNGRSFTDLLPIQPGIIPVTTVLPSSVMRKAGALRARPASAPAYR